MGFLASGNNRGNKQQKPKVSVETLHKLRCKVCPLDKLEHVHPRMEPTGPTDAEIYMLGEAPGREEDLKGEQFVGNSGKYLRVRIPERYRHRLRWNNTIHCHPPENRDPAPIEIECCRNFTVEDIERTKPKAIFGFGGFPLFWATGWPETSITKWVGKYLPVRVGSHSCWFFPFYHPAYMMRARNFDNGEDMERMFDRALAKAFDLVPNLPECAPVIPSDVSAGITIVDGSPGSLQKVLTFLEWASKQDITGHDLETQGLRPYNKGADILTVAVSDGVKTLAFPIHHPQARWTPREKQQVDEAFIAYLESPGDKVAHNLLFEQEWEAVKYGWPVIRKSPSHCSMVAASIIDERRGKSEPGCHSLEFQVQQYFGFNLKALSPNLDKTNMAGEPLSAILPYNARDAKWCMLLLMKQLEVLDSEGLLEVYQRAVRRVPTAVLTQAKGIPTDQPFVRVLHDKYSKRIKTVEARILADPDVQRAAALLGKKFNPLSSRHIQCLIEDVYHANTRSFEADELRALHKPVLDDMIILRQATKRFSTYIDPLLVESPKSEIYEDGLLHPQLRTTKAETGRSSADNVNNQNFPARDQEGKEVRKQVAAPPGCIIASFDYKQMQVCNIAMESNDTNLVRALREKQDIHKEWTEVFAKLFPSRLDVFKGQKDPIKLFRTDVKNQWTFPLFFGCNADTAASYLSIPVRIVGPQFERFWATYPGVKKMQQRFIAQYQQLGYVSGLTGRRRHGPIDINAIINSPIQADESELMFDAFSRLSEMGDPKFQANMEIHDDLTFILDKKTVEQDAEVIINEMLFFDAFPWINVPIGVEMSVGQNWEEKETIGLFYSDEWERK